MSDTSQGAGWWQASDGKCGSTISNSLSRGLYWLTVDSDGNWSISVSSP